MRKRRNFLYGVISVWLWIVIWHLMADQINDELFLPSPWETMISLKKLIVSQEFFRSVGYSLGNITKGFFLGIFTGSMLAVIASKSSFINSFLSLPIRVIKATPVASFTILALLWMQSAKLSILISFLMVLPIIYTNVLTGIQETDHALLEMASVFHVKWYLRVRYIYLPAVLPYLLSASSVAIGLAWKSGIAAEVIGIVKDSIGNHLYQSKIYLEIADLFAWTFVTVVISVLFEVIVLRLLKAVEHLSLGPMDTTTASGELMEETRIEQKTEQEQKHHQPIQSANMEPKKLLEVSQISKAYDGFKVLQDVSLSLVSGAPVALMGQSGIGKTTLLRILLGLEKADSGMVWKSEKTKQIAAVFQEDRLCANTSVYRNLQMVCKTKKQKQQIPTILENMGLTDCKDKRVSRLSGGMKRRVAIGRALLTDSNVILLDEPFRGLDQETKQAVMAFTKEETTGKALLLITHEKEEAEFFGCEIKTIVANRQLV